MKNFFAYSCALAARASGKPMEFFTVCRCMKR